MSFSSQLTQLLRWALILHWILAFTNSCNWLRWVTRFPCDIFGFYVAFIYLEKGVQVLARLGNSASFYLSIVSALLVFLFSYLCGVVGKSTFFTHPIRAFLKDYGTPLTLIFFTGFVHMGRMSAIDVEKLPTGLTFEPTTGRSWAVDLGALSTGQVFMALPFAVLLTVLFWFDHNGEKPCPCSQGSGCWSTTTTANNFLSTLVSSLIAQGSEFPLRKPAGFHWDIFLLGVTTGVAGVLGLPFPNGLIPQAPFHTQSLCVTKLSKERDEKGEETGRHMSETSHVVEQRVSNLAQGLLTLATMTGPLLVVLHLVPQGVLAGLFFVMGIQALEANGITGKLVFLATDKALTPGNSLLYRVQRRSKVWMFVAIEIFAFAATFAITQTIAAVGFPIFILALIPIRTLLLPRLFTPEELTELDAPTASPFTMEGIGGTYGGTDVTRPNDDDTAVHSRTSFVAEAEAEAEAETETEIARRSRSGDAPSSAVIAGHDRRSREDLVESGQAHSTARSPP